MHMEKLPRMMDVEIILRVLRENVVGRLSYQACRAIQLTGVRPAELVISRDVLDNYSVSCRAGGNARAGGP